MGFYCWGKFIRKEGKTGLAVKAFQDIQGGGLASAKAYNNLGILYIKMNQYKKARDAFIASINYYPQIPDAHYNLGKLILDLKENRTLAQNHLELALKL